MTPAGLAVLIFLLALALVLGVYAWMLGIFTRRDDRGPS